MRKEIHQSKCEEWEKLIDQWIGQRNILQFRPYSKYLRYTAQNIQKRKYAPGIVKYRAD